MSYNGIGLKSARGSATSGYVQRNLGHILHARPSFEEQKQEYAKVDQQREPNAEIIEHDRKRAVEVKVAEWADAQGLYDQELSLLFVFSIVLCQRCFFLVVVAVFGCRASTKLLLFSRAVCRKRQSISC